MSFATPISDGADGLNFQDQIIKSAQLAVCHASTSVEDARILLDMLGLVPDPVRFPSWDTLPRSTRTPPAQGASAVLPSSGYGAVYPVPPA